MKQLLLPALCGLLCLYSCDPGKMVSTLPNKPFPNTHVDSMTEWEMTDKGKETGTYGFTYDDNHRLLQIQGTRTDSTSDGGQGPVVLVTLSFGYNAADSIPASYSFDYTDQNQNTGSVNHALFYADGLLARDSVIDASYLEYTDFALSGTRVLHSTNQGLEGALTFDYSGNMLSDSSNGSGASWTYGVDRNPLYIPGFSKAGPALYEGLVHDFGSPNTIASCGLHPGFAGEWVYSWTKDSAGRVNSGTGVDAASKAPRYQVSFTYKK